MPAQAGIQSACARLLDSRFRGNDETRSFQRLHSWAPLENIKLLMNSLVITGGLDTRQVWAGQRLALAGSDRRKPE